MFKGDAVASLLVRPFRIDLSRFQPWRGHVSVWSTRFSSKLGQLTISFWESCSPWLAVRTREVWEQPFWNNPILPIWFQYAVCIYGARLKWFAPRALVFWPLVKGSEDSENGIGQFSGGSLLFAHDDRRVSPHVSAICLDSYNVCHRLQRTSIQFISFLKTILRGIDKPWEIYQFLS